MINKIIKVVLIIFLGLNSFVVNSQIEEERTHNSLDKKRVDEFLTTDGNLGDIYASTPCYVNCGRTLDVRDFTFTNNSSFNAALENHNSVVRAARAAHRIWFNRQKDIIKRHLENKYGQQFSNYEEAKNELFKRMEYNNFRINSRLPYQRYSSSASVGWSRQRGYIRDLKLLQLRKIEIQAGNLNNSALPLLKVDGVRLKDIRSLSVINTKWDNKIKVFGENNTRAHYDKYVSEKINSPGNDFFNQQILPVKNQYYNSFNDWDKLNLIQFLINYDKIKEILNCMVCIHPEEFKKFKNIEVTTSEMIENYAIKNRDGGESIFHPSYHMLVAYAMGSGEINHRIIHQAMVIVQTRRKEAIDNLLNNYDVNTLKIQNLIQELEISDNQQISWLFRNTSQSLEVINFLNQNRTNGVVSPEAKTLTRNIVNIYLNTNTNLEQKFEQFTNAYNEYDPPISSNQIIDYTNEVRNMSAYLKARGEREMGEYIESLTPFFNSFTIGEVRDIYNLVRKEYLTLKAKYMMAIFSPYTLNDIFFILDYGITTASLRTYQVLLNKIPTNYLVRSAKLEIFVKKVGLMGVRGDRTFVRIVTTSNPLRKATKLFEKLTQNNLTKKTLPNGTIVANMGNGNIIRFRPLSASSSGFKATIDLEFNRIWARTRNIKFK